MNKTVLAASGAAMMAGVLLGALIYPAIHSDQIVVQQPLNAGLPPMMAPDAPGSGQQNVDDNQLPKFESPIDRTATEPTGSGFPAVPKPHNETEVLSNPDTTGIDGHDASSPPPVLAAERGEEDPRVATNTSATPEKTIETENPVSEEKNDSADKLLERLAKQESQILHLTQQIEELSKKMLALAESTQKDVTKKSVSSAAEKTKEKQNPKQKPKSEAPKKTKSSALSVWTVTAMSNDSAVVQHDSGDTRVVHVGEMLGDYEVTGVDAEKGFIETTGGTLRYQR